MSEHANALPMAGLTSCAQNAEPFPEIGAKDRLLLALTAAFCVLLADTVLWYGPTAGAGAAVALWYGLVFAAAGPEGLKRRENQVLLVVNLLLAATLALTSNWYFRVWNFLALAVLIPVHLFSLSGAAALPWWRPAMLWERLRLLGRGLFCNLGASFSAVSRKGERGRRQMATVLGCLAAALLVAVLLPVLISADALFRAATAELTAFLRAHLTIGLRKLGMGLVMTPFFFGLLYRLGRPEKLKKPTQKTARTADDAPILIVLAALDVLYLFFLEVQAVGLFGGAAYLAAKGITYAEWARSGFFQMVGVTGVNLTVLVASVTLSRRTGRSWTVLRCLAAVLIVQSAILLGSSVWRMSLYVSVYGLSFKRVMTYWGMAVMAVFLGAAARKLWKPDFAFCRVAFLTAVLGWVAISFVPVDYLVARDNVDRYLDGRMAQVDVSYLAYGLSYDALGQLERLSAPVDGRVYDVASLCADRRAQARAECSRWQTWSLSACLAGR